MRTIKFRGRSGNSWVYGSLCIVEPEEFKEYGNSAYIGSGSTTMVDINTIGQFTGLHDKNGKEIYEGDILESLDFDKENKFVVEWNQVLAQFQGRWLHQPAIACDIYSMCHGGNYGVCGNIHDNPELLKGK